MGLLAPGIPISTRLALAIALSIGLPGCVPGATDHDDATSVHRFIRDRYPSPLQMCRSLVRRSISAPASVRPIWSSMQSQQMRIRTELSNWLVKLGDRSKKPIHITFMDAERFVGAKEGNLVRVDDHGRRSFAKSRLENESGYFLVTVPSNTAIDSDARKRVALPGARHRGR